MNDIEKQILENQITLLNPAASGIERANRILETIKILHPVEQPSIAERTHDAFSTEDAK